MVFFLFSLTSCEKDLYENNIKNENRAIIKKISFDDFKKNSPAFEKYQDLTTKKKQMNQGKIIYDSINNFYIDTDKIIFAQKDGISWFTFPVSRDYTFGKTENLILRSTISGKFVPLLLEYDFTFQDKQKVENNLEIPNLTEKTKVKFLEKLKIEDFESESENKEAEYYCVDIIYSWCSGDQKHPGGFESNGSKCPCHEESKIKVCNSTNNGSASPYNPGLPFGQSPPNYGSNTHGNGTNNSQIDINTTGGVYGNGGTNGLGIVTIPVLSVQTTTQIKLAFQAFLNNSAQIAWLNNPLNTNLRYTIIKYLTDNQVVIDVEQTNPTFIFAQEIIVQIMLNPTLYTSITPFLIEKKIDDNLLDPCSKSVFQQIKNTTNCDFANVLAKLNANDKIYKTKIITDYNYDNNGNQITDPGNTKRTIIGVKYDYTIYVNPNYSGKTKLYIASLLLHELTHAYFFSLLDDLNLEASNSFYELPILYNAFKNHTSNFNPALTHEEIANTYTSAISSALKEYAISTGTPSDFPNLDQICSDLAWAGLMDTDIYNSVHPEGSASWQRIKNRISSEQSGHPVTEGGITQNNIGQPCN